MYNIQHLYVISSHIISCFYYLLYFVAFVFGSFSDGGTRTNPLYRTTIYTDSPSDPTVVFSFLIRTDCFHFGWNCGDRLELNVFVSCGNGIELNPFYGNSDYVTRMFRFRSVSRFSNGKWNNGWTLPIRVWKWITPWGRRMFTRTRNVWHTYWGTN